MDTVSRTPKWAFPLFKVGDIALWGFVTVEQKFERNVLLARLYHPHSDEHIRTLPSYNGVAGIRAPKHSTAGHAHVRVSPFPIGIGAALYSWKQSKPSGHTTVGQLPPLAMSIPQGLLSHRSVSPVSRPRHDHHHSTVTPDKCYPHITASLPNASSLLSL